MSSLSDSGIALSEEAQEDASVRAPSNDVKIGTDQLEGGKTEDGKTEDGKTEDGKKKKKRGKRSKAKRGTGFEEFFCDPPMTPAEHHEEQTVLYPSYRPFVDRIEECIQRFRARRRLDSRRENLFSRYLLLGGVDATVRQFQGSRNLTDDVLVDASKGEVREMTADDVIQRGGDGSHNLRFYNPNYPEHWDVDFTGVVSGFLSEHLQNFSGSDLEDLWTSVEVVSNFLKYVDLHDVCPEYAADLKTAQMVCLRALNEIPAIEDLWEMFPGDFSTALQALHCKEEEGDHFDVDGNTGKEAPDIKQAQKMRAVVLSIVLGPENVKPSKETAVTSTIEQTFEICEVRLPDDAAQAKYKAINKHLGEEQTIEPCGTIVARPVVIKNGWDNSMTETIPPELAGKSEFILEESILELLAVGMKLTMEVCTMDDGFKFIKSIKDIKPSFYVFLPQELMLRYKEPVLNDRPGPSIHQEDVEDILAGVPIGDPED